ncbi:hypothetical protein N836_01380 [Leptolyngbya sp. Heron Island J]|uniref:hypothetical protein n=1 Tax=Leptolyngbya sp. Heron Island J TaxID=1385935 RepID=UPI0003B948B9|nr:hypothetical protein [Leptolyngbya sp. Heron Island J]ESA33942.1 hypothetical protein N836_01380 [Leptolyngbya sp. Heron Island J]
MLYPYWSPFNIAELPNWIQPGQLCLCSEHPGVSRSHIAIDCWLGNRWASQRPWALVMQIPSLDDAVWNEECCRPSDPERPVILVVQNSRYGGFYLGRRAYSVNQYWYVFNAGRWTTVPSMVVVGWLPIPHRLSHSFSASLETSRQRLLAQSR